MIKALLSIGVGFILWLPVFGNSHQLSDLSQKEKAQFLIYEPGANRSTVFIAGQSGLVYPQPGELTSRGFSWNSDILHYGFPTLSPDGTRIAFVRRLNSQSRDETITVYSPASKTYLDVITLPLSVYALAWSPVNDTIAFLAKEKDGYKFILQQVNLQGQSAPELLTPAVFGPNDLFSWSPDGKKIVIEQSIPNESDPAKEKQLLILDLETTTLKFLTYGYNPSWSPTEQKIAFLDIQQKHCFQINSDGTKKQKLFTYRELLPSGQTLVGPLVWSPDSRFLVYHITDGMKGDRRKVFCFELKNGKKRRVKCIDSFLLVSWKKIVKFSEKN